MVALTKRTSGNRIELDLKREQHNELFGEETNMTPKEPNPQDMENLSRAIVEAILGSGDVKQAMEKLNMPIEGFGKNFMVFVVNLESVSEFQKKEKKTGETSQQEPPKPRRRKPTRKDSLPDLIDGRIVTDNEKKFQDFMAENFDSGSWLKKLKLRLE
jgi:hypothetical protein